MFHRLVNDCCTPESIWILKQLYLIGLDVPSPINVGRQLGWVCVGVMNDLLPSLVHYSWYKRPLAVIFNVQVVDEGSVLYPPEYIWIDGFSFGNSLPLAGDPCPSLSPHHVTLLKRKPPVWRLDSSCLAQQAPTNDVRANPSDHVESTLGHWIENPPSPWLLAERGVIMTSPLIFQMFDPKVLGTTTFQSSAVSFPGGHSVALSRPTAHSW